MSSGSRREGLGIQLGPLARRDRDFGQLPPRGAVLVHVARRDQRIGRGRVERLVRALEPVRIEHAARGVALLAPECRGALGAAVADQHRIAHTQMQRHHRRQLVGDERRAADVGPVDEFRPHAQVLGHVLRPRRSVEVGGAQTVHVLHRKARVLDCRLRGLGQDLQVGHALRLAASGESDADDGNLAAQILETHFAFSTLR